nr:uncharacterized protein LOC111426785 [Onthophagus taurus]
MGFLTKLPNLSRTCIFLRFLPKQQPQYMFKSPQIIQRKTITSRFVAKDTANTFRIHDNIPAHYELIYRIKLAKYIFWAQVASTIIVGIVLISVLYNETPQNINTHDWSQEVRLHLNNEEIIYLSAILGICVILNFFVAKLPVRVYYYKRNKQYIAVRYGNILNKIKKMHFQRNDVVKLPESGFLPWKGDWYHIRNQTNVILFETSFRAPSDQSILLGYQNDDEDD